MWGVFTSSIRVDLLATWFRFLYGTEYEKSNLDLTSCLKVDFLWQQCYTLYVVTCGLWQYSCSKWMLLDVCCHNHFRQADRWYSAGGTCTCRTAGDNFEFCWIDKSCISCNQRTMCRVSLANLRVDSRRVGLITGCEMQEVKTIFNFLNTFVEGSL